MRWERLFADVEAQWEALERAEQVAEVADRTRREVGRLRLVDRLGPGRGAQVTLTVQGVGVVRGLLVNVGPDWAFLLEPGGRECVVAMDRVLGVLGVGGPSESPEAESEVAKRLDLRFALRGLVRERAGVQVVLVDGSTVSGTFDRVGADHVDLAEHPAGEQRRAAAVRQVRLVPLAAVALVRSN